MEYVYDLTKHWDNELKRGIVRGYIEVGEISWNAFHLTSIGGINMRIKPRIHETSC